MRLSSASRLRATLALLSSLAALACGGPPVAPEHAPPATTSAGPVERSLALAGAARAAVAANRPKTAENLWLQAAALRDDWAEPRRALAALLEAEPERALPHLAWLAARPEAEVADLRAWVAALRAAERPVEAAEAARSALVRFPADPALGTELVCALLAQGELAAAFAARRDLASGESVERRLAVAEVLVGAGHEDLAVAELDAALEVAPGDVRVWRAYGRAQRTLRRPERAVAVLRSALASHPDDPSLLAELGRALEAVEAHDEAVTVWEQAALRAPDDPEIADGRARSLLAADHVEDALAAWEAGVQRFPEAGALRMHLALALRLRDAGPEVVRVLRPWAATRPEDARAQTALGEALLAAGDPEATAVLERALAAGGEPRLVHGLLARARAETGNAEAARSSFSQALGLDPGNAPLRMSLALFCLRIGDVVCGESELLRLLARDRFDTRARELLEAVLSGNPMRETILAGIDTWPAARLDPELSALAARVRPAEGAVLGAVLRDEREVTVDAGRVTRLVHRRSVLVQRPAAADRYGEIALSFNVHRPAVVRRARILTPDGDERPLPPAARTVRDPQKGGPLRGDARELVLRFPGLEPGSILDYEVEVPAPHPEHLGAWWDRYVLANVDPTIQATYVLDVPDGTDFRAEATGMGDAQETRAEGRKRLRWSRADLAPTPLDAPEPGPIASISVASVSDWKGVAQWYAGLFEPQAEITAEIAAAARQAVAGKGTRRARIAALLHRVESQIEYLGDEMGIGAYQPRPAGQTLASGRGDCKDVTALLAAMLRAVGIEAWPALVRPDGPGVFGEAHPTPAQFTHVLLYVPDSEGDYWLDATARLGTVDAVPAVLRGRTVLIVDGKAGRVMRIPAEDPVRSRLEETLEMTLTPTGGGELSRTLVLRGDVAGEVRQRLLALDAAARERLLRAPGIALGAAYRPDRVTISGLDDNDGPLTLEARLAHRDLVGLRSDGSLVVRLDLESLVGPALSGGGRGPPTGRRIERLWRLRPPGGRSVFTWEPMRLRLPGPLVDLRADERRVPQATEIVVGLRLASLPRDETARTAWLEALEAARTRLDRQLVMRPGPGFDPVGFYRSLLEERPADPQLALLLARSLIRDGHAAEARAAVEEAVQRSPESAPLVRMWLDLQGGEPGAVDWGAVERLVGRHGADADVQSALGDLAARVQDVSRAERAYRAAIIKGPHARALNNLAWLLREDPQRRAEALDLARQAVKADADSDAAWDTLAELLYLTGDPAGALAASDEALRRGPAQAEQYRERRRRYEDALKRGSGPRGGAPPPR